MRYEKTNDAMKRSLAGLLVFLLAGQSPAQAISAAAQNVVAAQGSVVPLPSIVLSANQNLPGVPLSQGFVEMSLPGTLPQVQEAGRFLTEHAVAVQANPSLKSIAVSNAPESSAKTLVVAAQDSPVSLSSQDQGAEAGKEKALTALSDAAAKIQGGNSSSQGTLHAVSGLLQRLFSGGRSAASDDAADVSSVESQKSLDSRHPGESRGPGLLSSPRRLLGPGFRRDDGSISFREGARDKSDAVERKTLGKDSLEKDSATDKESAEGKGSAPAEEEEEESWETLAVLAGLSAAFGLAALGVSYAALGPAWLPGLLYGASMVAGGYDALKDSAHDIPKGKFDVHFLMLAVAVGAAFVQELPEGALLLFLFSASHAMELYAEHRTRKGIDALLSAAPKTARLEKDGVVSEVPIERIAVGDILVLLPGNQVPVDAEVVSGRTTVDESNLTGESLPITKEPGDSLRSGSFNKSGVVRARAVRPAAESTFQKLTRLIHEAQNLRAPSQRFTDKFSTPYTFAILGASALLFAALCFMGMPPFTVPVGGTSAFYRAVTLLVVASPCALVLSIPSAILAAIARGTLQRILFRGGAAVERMALADVVAMDKTGTLTTGELHVERVEVLSGAARPDAGMSLLRAAAALERNSTHPVAAAIARYADDQGLSVDEPEDFKEVEGFGVQGRFDGKETRVGRKAFIESQGNVEPIPGGDELDPGTMSLWVAHGPLIGRILLRDEVRPESAEVVAKLRSMGKRVVMLTGDREEVAARIAEQLGVDEYRAGLAPDEKFKAVEGLKAAGHKVVMVGDGLNDAAALAAADVSVGMGGARSTDAALENSDVVLMKDSLQNLLAAFELSAYARRIITVNLVVSLGVILTMVASAILGIIPLSVGMVIHESSTILVCMLSMLLLVLPLSGEKQAAHVPENPARS
ncbi:MAG: cation-translocating P-type ATPase [Elusimicrobiota bacterium]|jgi:Cd2+/Zn2+-exporting ATPase